LVFGLVAPIWELCLDVTTAIKGYERQDFEMLPCHNLGAWQSRHDCHVPDSLSLQTRICDCACGEHAVSSGASV
jgi:hypothetical protein